MNMPDMNPRRLKQLADVIDATFLNGSFAEVGFIVPILGLDKEESWVGW